MLVKYDLAYIVLVSYYDPDSVLHPLITAGGLDPHLVEPVGYAQRRELLFGVQVED